MKTESKGNCGHPSHPIPCPYDHAETKSTPGLLARGIANAIAEESCRNKKHGHAPHNCALDRQDARKKQEAKASTLLEECRDAIDDAKTNIEALHIADIRADNVGMSHEGFCVYCQWLSNVRELLAKLEKD